MPSRFSTCSRFAVPAFIAILFATVDVRSAIEPTPGDRQALAEFREVAGGKIKLDYSKKVARVQNFCERIDVILPMLADPAEMLAMTRPIVDFGVNKDANNLEFLGENARIERHLKPITGAMMQLLDAAAKIARQRADGMTTSGLRRDTPAWEKADELAQLAAYTRDTVVYYDCIAIDPNAPIHGKDSKIVRKSLALEAIAHLTEFDNPDSGLQPRIRNLIARLYLAAGDNAKARQLFAMVQTDPPTLRPAPTYSELFDAKFFTVTADLQAEDLPAATRDKQSLDAWQTEKVPALFKKSGATDDAIAANLRAIAASSAMLKWRVLRLKARLAKDDASYTLASNEATSVLIELRISRPDLIPTIDLYDPLKARAEIPGPGAKGFGKGAGKQDTQEK